jgi:hypothetical protein
MVLMKKNFIAIITIFLSFLFLPSLEADERGIELSPLTTEFVAKTGTVTESRITLNNKNDYPLKFLVKAAEIQDEQIIFNTAQSLWINPSVKEFILEPQKSSTVDYSIAVPIGSVEKVYRLLLIFEVQPINDSSNFNSYYSTLESNIAQTILLTVTNESELSGELIINDFITKSIVYKSPFMMNFYIKNDSDTFYSKPVGIFQIVKSNGQIVRQQIINENLDLLLPKEDLFIEHKYEFSLFDINNVGKYKAEILVTDSITGKTITKSIDFYIIPYPFIIGIGAVLLSFYFVGVLVFQLRKNGVIKLRKRERYK